MDTPEKIARELRTIDESIFTEARISQGAKAIREYGAQCRQAGAAAMREAAALSVYDPKRHVLVGPPTEQDFIKAMADEIRKLPLPPAAEVASPAAGWRPTHRHYKGGLYRKLFEGTFESNLLPVIVYQNEEGHVWVRPTTEFNGSLDENGYIKRFEPVLGSKCTNKTQAVGGF